MSDTSLGTKTLKSAFWAYGSYIGGRLLVLVSVAVLARVLVPEDFGLVALALTFTALLETFRDFGLSQALIVSKEEDLDTKANTVFFYGLGIALVGMVATCALSPWIADFFGEPDLQPILLALSLNFPLRALGQTHNALSQKTMNFRARTAAEISDVTVRGAVGIAFALLGFGAWSLVWGMLAGALVFAVVLWKLIPWRPHLRKKRSHAKELFTFGGTLTGVDVMHGLTTSADTLIIGRVLGPIALGFYTIGFRLPQLMVVNLSVTASIVLFPAYTKVEGERLRSAYLQSLRYTLVVAAPLAAGLIAMASPIILGLFGDQWGPSAPVMQIITLYTLCLALEIPGGTIFKVTGKASILLWLSIPRTIALFGFIAVFAHYGINTVAWTLSAVTGAFALVALLMAARIIRVSIWSMIVAVWAPTAAAVASGVAMYALVQVIPFTWPSIAAGTIVGAVVYLGVLWLVARESLMYLVRKLSPKLAAKLERQPRQEPAPAEPAAAAPPPPPRPRRPADPARRTVVLTSVLVGIVALIGGILGIASRSTAYSATAEVSIVPKTENPEAAVGAVDTLSRGPVTSNFAEAYGSSRVVDEAFRAAGISEADADRVSVSASVITDTSFVLVSASADEPVLAERAANAVAAVTPDLGGYSAAYTTELYDSADGTAARTGAGTITLLLIAIVVAAVLAVATAAVLGRVFRGPRGGPGPPPSRGTANGNGGERAGQGRRRKVAERL